MTIEGKHNFKAVWDCNDQRYAIYSGVKFIRYVYSFSEVKNYIY